nr:hypothetical protein CFP56_69452 [Quercus suber]
MRKLETLFSIINSPTLNARSLRRTDDLGMAEETIHSTRHEQDLLVLHDALDDAWAKYLNCLDVYQEAQIELGKVMSAANFTSTDRRRYGRDYYDERMKASRRYHFVEPPKNSELKAQIASPGLKPILVTSLVDGNDSTAESSPDETGHHPEQQITTRDDVVDAKKPKDERQGKASEPNDEGPDESDAKVQLRNPITWYGILVPQQLRVAQTSFSTAMSDTALKLFNAATELRDREAEIRTTRKSIRKLEKLAGT